MIIKENSINSVIQQIIEFVCKSSNERGLPCIWRILSTEITHVYIVRVKFLYSFNSQQREATLI